MGRRGLLCALLFLFPGCAGEEEAAREQRKKAGQATEILLDALELKGGRHFLEGSSEAFTGTAIRRFNNGEIAVSSQFLDGVQDGRQVEWLKSGTKKRETLFRDGEAYFQTIWRGDGSKKIESEMKGDMPHGSHKRWYPSGKLGFVGEFFEGNFHGVVEDRDEDGKLLMRARYEKGKFIENLMSEEASDPARLSPPSPQIRE